jgi:hypothetical protein
MHGGGKLQVKDLQPHKSKVMFALFFVYKDMPFHIVKKTIKDILCEDAEMVSFQRMLHDNKSILTTLSHILIYPQVPCLKGADTLAYNKLPYHVPENRNVLHIEVKPEDEKVLKELFQYAKEQNLVTLCLGKCTHISKVMDAKSTPGKIKRMVKYAMGHATIRGQ